MSANKRAFRPDAPIGLEARDVPSSFNMFIRPAAMTAAATRMNIPSFTFNPAEFGSRFGFKPGMNFGVSAFNGFNRVAPVAAQFGQFTATAARAGAIPAVPFGTFTANTAAARSAAAGAVMNLNTFANTYLFHANSLSTEPMVLQHNASIVINGVPASLGGFRF